MSQDEREAVEYCEPCNGPVFGRSDLELDLSHIAYWIAMRWPHAFFANWLHLAILPWAGNVAFACSCRDKNHAAREATLTAKGRAMQ